MRRQRRATTLAFTMAALLLLAACESAVPAHQVADQRASQSAAAADVLSPADASGPTDTVGPTAAVLEPPPTKPKPTATDTPAATQAESTATPAGEESSYEIITLLPPDAIPSIDDPKFYGVEEADREYLPEELVLGVEVDGEARAYSVGLLSRHEIVNDTLAGRPISVTW